MKTFFSADPFSAGAVVPGGVSLGKPRLAEGSECVLIGTITHVADGETLYDRTEKKYEDRGWVVVKKGTGRILYAGTPDEIEVTHIWACPPGVAAPPEKEANMSGCQSFLGQVPLAPNLDVASSPRPQQVPLLGNGGRGGRAFTYKDDDYWDCDPRYEVCPVPPVGWVPSYTGIPFGSAMRLGQGLPSRRGPHWVQYDGTLVRWPDCDPRYDAQCPYPTTIIVDRLGLGQVGPVGGFGGPGGAGGFGGPAGFVGGPGGLVGSPVGPVEGMPSPGSGPITGPSIPCGPAGYGPTCAYPQEGTTVMQEVYPIDGVLGRGGGGGGRGGGGWRGGVGPRPRGRFIESGSAVICGPDDYGPGCYPVVNLAGSDSSHANQGHENWYNPYTPCPPGQFRSSPGSPCVSPGDVVDNGQDYFRNP